MTNILFVALIVRILFVIYGTFHDRYFEVKYTDIDYTVFTEAAEHLTKNASPYLKETYKYTPLLAYILTPNIYIHILFGKVLFCAVDILVAALLSAILKLQRNVNEERIVFLILSCWLFNPFTITISSRGNAESIQILLVILTLLFTIRNQIILAALVYGVAVHFKIYPVIYSLPLVLYIGSQHVKLKTLKTRNTTLWNQLKSFLHVLINFQTILFGLVSLFTFLSVGCFMYIRHGFAFIEHTYLFHMKRYDFQHNFSPYFYILRIFQHSEWLDIINRLAFLPQLITVTWFGLKYYDRIELACFLQTFAFVSFNKVCTSQYFIWYIGIFPLAYIYMNIPLRKCIQLLTVWFASQGVWLFSAYLLEFKKWDVAFYVWLSSLLFLFTNIYILWQFTRYATTTETQHQQQQHQQGAMSTPHKVERRPSLKKNH